MPTLNDLILSVTGGPTVNDGLMSYFGGSGPLNDRERAWLIGQGVAPGPLNDMWMRYLGGIGYDGALNDRLYQFWAGGGSISLDVTLQLTIGSGATLLGYSQGFIGALAPTDVDGFTISSLVTTAAPSEEFVLNFNATKTPRNVYYVTMGGETYPLTWEPVTEDYRVVSVEARGFMLSNVGNTVPVRITSSPPYLNVAENSAWENASGSVAGANFIAPTSWGLSFWPPDNAIVLPAADAQVRFIANANRGFFNQNFDAASVPLGQLFNISVYVDELNAPTTNLVMGCSGPVQMISQTFPVVQGRNSAVYRTTAASGIVNFRIGLGITANATGDVTLSRPQVTLGEFLRPYRRTAA